MVVWLTFACRLAVGALFLLAGGAKLANPGSFAATVLAYQVVPPDLIRPMAVALPWVEVLLGLYLVAGLFARIAAWAAIAFLAVFIGAIGQAVLRGLSLEDCGCFGDVTKSLPWLAPFLGGSSSGPGDIVRDLVYACLALVVALGPRTPYSLDSLLRRRHDGPDE